MLFTALHRLLGRPPGPLGEHFLDEAVDAQLAETDDLDWKAKLPPGKKLLETDFPKDIAAMANRGGGTIVYGISESNKVASGRVDAGELTESHERALRAVATSAISPPVLGLGVYRLGEEGNRAVVVVVPATHSGPHLVYRNELFGAPVRNDADTVWLREPQIEAQYRSRFQRRQDAREAIASLYDEATYGDADTRSWFVFVARPAGATLGRAAPSRDEFSELIRQAGSVALEWVQRDAGAHPFASIDRHHPRPGLRRWSAMSAVEESGELRRYAASVSIHNDGAVVMKASVGGHSWPSHEELRPQQVYATTIEAAVADAMATLRLAAGWFGTTEYDLRVGIEWQGSKPLVIHTRSWTGQVHEADSVPLNRFSHIEMSVNADTTDDEYLTQVCDLAEHCINQGGIHALQELTRPPAAPTAQVTGS